MIMYGAIMLPICAHVEAIFKTVVRILVGNCSLVNMFMTTVDKCNKLLATTKHPITIHGYSFGMNEAMTMAIPRHGQQDDTSNASYS